MHKSKKDIGMDYMSLLSKISTEAFLFCSFYWSLCSTTNALALPKLRSSRGRKATDASESTSSQSSNKSLSLQTSRKKPVHQPRLPHEQRSLLCSRQRCVCTVLLPTRPWFPFALLPVRHCSVTKILGQRSTSEIVACADFAVLAVNSWLLPAVCSVECGV